VVTHLFGGGLFGGQQDREPLVAAVARAVGPGEFERMANATFGRQRGRVHGWAKIKSDLNVTQFHRGVDPMDGHVGGAKRRPYMVSVLAEAVGRFLCRCTEGSRRRLRRRWPGVSAGLSLGEARPAHAGPQPLSGQIKVARTAGRPAARNRRSLPIVQLAATVSRVPRAVACDRLRRGPRPGVR